MIAAQKAPRGEYGETTALRDWRGSMTGIPSPLSRMVNEKVNPRDRVTVRLYERSSGVSMAVGTLTRTPEVTGVAAG